MGFGTTNKEYLCGSVLTCFTVGSHVAVQTRTDVARTLGATHTSVSAGITLTGRLSWSGRRETREERGRFFNWQDGISQK